MKQSTNHKAYVVENPDRPAEFRYGAVRAEDYEVISKADGKARRIVSEHDSMNEAVAETLRLNSTPVHEDS